MTAAPRFGNSRALRLAGAAALALLAPLTARAQQDVDTFATGQAVLTAPPGGVSSVATAGPDILGQHRGLSVALHSGAGPATVQVSGGVLAFSVATTAPASRGEAVVTWDGDTDARTLSASGLGGVNLSAAGDAFRLTVPSASAGVELTLTVYTDAGNASVYGLLLPAIGSPTDIDVEFGSFVTLAGTGANFTSVGAITLTVRGTGATLNLDRVQVVASTAAVTASMTDGVTSALPGATLDYSVTVGNTGPGTANGVTLSDTLDAATTLVPGSLEVSPVAFDDQYVGATIGNVFTIVAPGVLANDVDGNGDPLTVVPAGPRPTTQGGTATVNGDGSFSYTPPAAFRGLDRFPYQADDGHGIPGPGVVTVHVDCGAIGVSPTTLATAVKGSPYGPVTFTATGATGTTAWSLVGALPTGMNFSAAGVLDGTPTQDGSFPLTFVATDSVGCSGTQAITLSVNSAPTITSAASTTFAVDGTAKSFTVTTTGIPTPALTKTGALPASLTFTDLGNGTATIAGTPIAADVSDYPLTITANNGVGSPFDQAFTLHVTCAVITVTNPGASAFTVGQAIPGTPTFTQSGGTAGGTFTANGTLPTGVTLSSAGVLSGTPTQTGSFPITVTYTMPGGCSGTSVTYNLQINCPTITVSPSTLVDALFGQPYGPVSFSQVGSTGSSFTWTSTALPGAGLSFTTAGVLSAASTTNTGVQSVTFTVTDNFSCTGARTINNFAVRPIASSDTFNNGVGNTQYLVAGADSGSSPHVFVTGSILSNDVAPLGAKTATPSNPAVGGAGGAVTLATDGTFLFTPALNSIGAATFLYTLTDVNGVTNTGLVTINLANVVWYVKAGGSGDGRSNTPLGSVATAATNAAAGHYIFVHSPSGTPDSFSGAVTLKSGQTIWGQGTDFTLGGLTIPASAPTPTKPVISGTLNLASGVTVSSLDVSAGAASGVVGAGTSGAHLAGVTIKNNVAVTTTTGTAVSLAFVDSTTGAGNGINFLSVSSNGGSANGIILQNTTGTFVVTGSGTAGSGGTIANKSGADGSTTQGSGIFLTSAAGVSLSRMQLSGFQNFAIRGTSVTGFTFDNSVISGVSGTSVGAFDEAAVSFTNLLGSASITNSNIGGGFEYVLKVNNTSGTLNRLTVDGTTFGGNHDAVSGNGGDAVQIVAANSATVNVTVTNSTFTSAGEDLFNAAVTQAGNMDLVFRNNALSNSHANKTSAASNILLFSTSTGAVSYDISHNTLTTGATGSAIAAAKGVPDSGTGGTMAGTINANTIGLPGVVGSGSDFTGIFASALGTGTHTTAITNNTIYHYNEEGIFLKANDSLGGGTSVLNATVTGNQTLQPDSLAFAGLWVLSGSGSGSESQIVNVVVGNASTAPVAGSPTGSLQNDFTAGDPSDFSDVEIQEAGSGSIVNLSKAGSVSLTVAGVIQDDNVGTPSVDSSGNIVLVNTLPPLPPPVAP